MAHEDLHSALPPLKSAGYGALTPRFRDIIIGNILRREP